MNVEKALLKVGSLGFFCGLAAIFSEYVMTTACRFLRLPIEVRSVLVAFCSPIIIVAAGWILAAIWSWPDVTNQTRARRLLILVVVYFVGVLVAGVIGSTLGPLMSEMRIAFGNGASLSAIAGILFSEQALKHP